MHIVCLAGCLSSQRGGIEKSLLDVSRELAKRGHDISVVYVEDGDQLDEYRRFCRHLVKISTYRFGLKKVAASFRQIQQDFDAVLALRGDVIYSSQYDNFFFGSQVARRSRTPFVCHVRLPAPVERGWFKRLKQRHTLGAVRQYIAVSESTRQDWSHTLAIAPDKITTIHNGIDTQKFPPPSQPARLRQQLGLSPEQTLVAYVGRLDPQKGIEVLMRGFAEFAETHSAFLSIAGKSLIAGDSYEQSLKDLSQSLGVADQVKFLGHIDRPSDLYQNSDVLVVPSLWPEPFGRVLIESMACGTPVLGSRTGGIPEILTGEFESMLFEPGSVEELAAKLTDIADWRLRDPDLARRCQAHVSRHFDLQQNITKVETILLNALSSAAI